MEVALFVSSAKLYRLRGGGKGSDSSGGWDRRGEKRYTAEGHNPFGGIRKKGGGIGRELKCSTSYINGSQ